MAIISKEKNKWKYFGSFKSDSAAFAFNGFANQSVLLWWYLIYTCIYVKCVLWSSFCKTTVQYYPFRLHTIHILSVIVSR